MSQYNTRLAITFESELAFISVKNGFSKLKMQKYGFAERSDEALFSFKKKSNQIVMEEFSCSDDDLEDLVLLLSKIIKTKGIIIADTTNRNVNPYIYGVYFAGDGIKTFYYDEIDPRCELQDQVKISDVTSWFEKAVSSISEKEKKRLGKSGIKPTIKIQEDRKKSNDNYKSVGFMYVTYGDEKTADDAFKKWIVVKDQDGVGHSVSELKKLPYHVGRLERDGRSFILNSLYGMNEQECRDYLVSHADIFTQACVIGIVWNGKDSGVYIVYSFGDGIKEKKLEILNLKTSINRSGLSLDEAVNYDNIYGLFGENLAELSPIEIKRLQDCKLL